MTYIILNILKLPTTIAFFLYVTFTSTKITTILQSTLDILESIREQLIPLRYTDSNQAHENHKILPRNQASCKIHQLVECILHQH